MDFEKIQYNLETGEAFNDLISAYPISGEKLLKMCKVLCEFVAVTQITDIEKYFFVDIHKGIPRLPSMLDFEEQYRIIANAMISELKGEMYINEQGNEVLNKEINECKIGINYGLNKAIGIIKEYAQKFYKGFYAKEKSVNEEYIRGHYAKAGINDCSDWFIPDNVLDDILKPFMIDKKISVDKDSIYSTIIRRKTDD